MVHIYPLRPDPPPAGSLSDRFCIWDDATKNMARTGSEDNSPPSPDLRRFGKLWHDAGMDR
jgi:hypothetical protein